MKTLIPQATPRLPLAPGARHFPTTPPVTPPGAPQPPPVSMEPRSDSVPVPVTHTASSPGPMNSPSSPPLDENWNLVFSRSLSQRANYSRSETPRLPSRSIPSSETEQAQKIPLPTHAPGSPPYPATPPALLPVCPSSPSPSPATAPGANTSWSLAFSPSQNQSNPLLSFEATLELLLNGTHPKGEKVSTTPLKIPTPPPPITLAQVEGTRMAPQTAPPDWRPILSPPFTRRKSVRERPPASPRRPASLHPQ
ncbi:hypothetical protein JTE90_028360 [Oedothorax gibbosus]|uniref:Uncharacterized protein n=1 Tax=Oedothorax gibbosus TaxID=931172 RepID=A0AAV6TQG5_9ARAC|nr:hypothetical protein JTE90_028360 [Oedothorax gibbosus]